MSLAGSTLLTGLSAFIGDVTDPAGLTTSAAGDSAGTTLIDETLGEYDDDALVGRWIRITQSGSNQYLVRKVVKNESVSGLVEVRPAFAAQVGASDTYELHKYDPRGKFTALDEARLRVVDVLSRHIYDDTTTADGVSRVFPIPSTLRKGPVLVMEECPFAADVDWNFLSDPNDDSVSNWTGSSATLSVATRLNDDPLIPKYDNSCMKIVVAASTAATVSQVVGSMTNGITAALAAGRTMTFAKMVYSRIASKVRLQIIDDGGTTSGSYHQGKGWELLTVERDIDGANSSLLTARIDITSTSSALTAYANRGWFYFGTAERVRDGLYYGNIPKRTRRDDTTQQVYLDWVPGRGRQLRMIGQETLTALGTTASTQVTNTMEVDEENAQILYAEAARILFSRLGLNLSDYSTVAANIAAANALRSEMKNTWGQDTVSRRITGMWAR